MLAGLLPEPSNQYDPNAVGVWVNGLKVGHLSRDDAAWYSVALEPLTAKGIVGTRPAVIVGGWDRGRGDEGHFGVKLKLGPPEYVLDAAVTPPDNALPEYLRDLREATTPKGRRRVLERAIQAGLRDDSGAAPDAGGVEAGGRGIAHSQLLPDLLIDEATVGLSQARETSPS